MDASVYMLIQGVSWVLLALVTLGNGALGLFNWRSLSSLRQSEAGSSRLSTLETTSAAHERRIEGLEGSNLSTNRKLNKLKFDRLHAPSEPEELSESGTTDPELRGISAEHRHLFERPN